jgi:hypothetical protein
MSETKPQNLKTIRWNEAEWERVRETAEAVGLTRSEFVRRATLAAMHLPSALCGALFSAHNAASVPSSSVKKRVAKQADSAEGLGIARLGDSPRPHASMPQGNGRGLAP